ncbi:MAG: class I SAM-dependent methyltransferase [Candidatus Omnitrophica bacterium]|nr:class I SAM-dependent methyltransferase [Candidatus Omnitrophota bacterium]
MRKRIILPKEIGLINFENKELKDFNKFVFHPFFGLFYKNRFKMMNNFLQGHYDKALEIGFGPGAFLPTLATSANHVYGIDLHKEIAKVRGALKNSKINKISLLNADIYRIPFRDETFDLVICQSVLEHLTDLEKAFNEIGRVLKKGGKLIIGFPLKNKLTKKLFALLGYQDEEIHPSGHKQIMENCKKKFSMKKCLYFPRFLGTSQSLYFAGEFNKGR